MARHRAGRPCRKGRLLVFGAGAVAEAAPSWLLYSALVAAGGAVATRWLVAPRTAGPARLLLVQTAARTGTVASACLVAAMAAVLWRQFVQFRDPFSPWTDELRLLVAGTAWGRLWTGAAGASLAALLAFTAALPRRRLPAWVSASLVVVALCAFPAFSGHAAGTAVRWLSIPLDALHVLAAGSWAGGLLIVLATERASRRSGGSSALPDLVPAFSPVALASAAVLAGTGGALAWLHLGSLPAVWQTPWGRAFAVKIALVTVMLAVGAWNWKRLTPRLRSSGGPEAMGRAALAELALAQAIVLATAALVQFSPPAAGSFGAPGH